MDDSVGSPDPHLKPSSLGTPRRRLRLSLGSDSSGCGGDGSFSTSPCGVRTGRTPLGEIKTLHPNIQESRERPVFCDQENIAPCTSTYRPSSLPCLSSTPAAFLGFQGGGPPKPKGARRNICKQISSPMGRMSLMSPCGLQQRSPRRSSANSDGYSEFEEIEAPPISSALSSLISTEHGGDLPSPVNRLRFSEKIDDIHTVVRPTPQRPSSYHQGDGSFWDTEVSSAQRRGSLKRCSPMNQSDMAHHKRRCLPLPPDPNTSVSPGSGEESFIGDHSKPYALPLVKGRGTGLKHISPDTLCNLLDGKFEEIDSYQIFDCRFPYEYEGGHIEGATNMWTEDALVEHLFSSHIQYPQDGHRNVIVFHCEFSSKRGPNMCRLLRTTDREKNGITSFPKLFYPELYLLDGGYKAFFAKHPEKCVPQSYCRMEDQNFTAELKRCQRRTKSWSSGETRAPKHSKRRQHSTQ